MDYKHDRRYEIRRLCPGLLFSPWRSRHYDSAGHNCAKSEIIDWKLRGFSENIEAGKIMRKKVYQIREKEWEWG